VDLLEVIAMGFFFEDFAGRRDIFDVFPSTCSDDAILEPSVRAFNLSFGLRREGIVELNMAFL
jgi:hypothetical protein